MNRLPLAFAAVFAFTFAMLCAPLAIAADITVRHTSVRGGSAVLDTFCAASFDGVTGTVYNFSGVCGGTNPPPAPNQLTRANVGYGHDTNPTHVARNADLTRWEETWGRVAYNETGWVWPAASGARPHFQLGRDQFACTKFSTTNATGLSILATASYETVGNLDVSIAPTCGLFTQWQDSYSEIVNGQVVTHAIGGPSCSKSAIGAYASQFMTYRMGDSTGTATRPGFCGLAPRRDYFVNVRFTNGQPIPATGPLCSAAGRACQIGIQSNPSPR